MAYVLVGTVAVVVWVLRGPDTVDHVAALASTVLGLALIIVAAFFRQPPEQPRAHAGPVPAPRTSSETPPREQGAAVAP